MFNTCSADFCFVSGYHACSSTDTQIFSIMCFSPLPVLQCNALTCEVWSPIFMEVVAMTGKKIQFKHLRRIHLMENDAQVD